MAPNRDIPLKSIISPDDEKNFSRAKRSLAPRKDVARNRVGIINASAILNPYLFLFYFIQIKIRNSFD